MAPKPAIDRRTRRLAETFTPAWLAAQRWYRSKSLRLVSVELSDVARFAEGPGWLLVLRATHEAGGAAHYLVPAVADGDAFREPRDGEGVWRGLASLIVAGGELQGTNGTWAFAPTALSDIALEDLSERRLAAEQSNTSVAFDDRLMLKVYRLLEPGGNPEVEVNAFLTMVGFADVPTLAGAATYLIEGELHSAAMLQQFVPSSGDGWGWVLNRLAAGPHGAGEAISGIAQIGSLTARMHAALASRPKTRGFPSRSVTAEELAAWRIAARTQLEAAMAALDASRRARLAAIAPMITKRLDAILTATSAQVTRIHGDYHLGQLLRTERGFVAIDFEGEPARTLAERGAPASPLRDVAGMLRSLDYAAHTVEATSWSQDAVALWLREARAALLAGYGRIQQSDQPLLDAFELEKACYEIRYEANNRPDWVWLPLDALERLAITG
jgi:maltose alpha-D-glucosyltransferase/alpha-amylase